MVDKEQVVPYYQHFRGFPRDNVRVDGEAEVGAENRFPSRLEVVGLLVGVCELLVPQICCRRHLQFLLATRNPQFRRCQQPKALS